MESPQRFATAGDAAASGTQSAHRADCVAFVADNQTLDVVSAACEPRFLSVLLRDGGSREALEYLSDGAPPRVLIVDVTDSQNPLTAVLPITTTFGETTRVIAIGNLNDINLYHQMIEAGVVEYLVKPVMAKALAGTLARLDEKTIETAPTLDAAQRRLVAVMGTRGGVGASMVAINCAWLIAHEQKRSVTLLDLDLQYGTVALSLDIEPSRGLREVLENPGRIDSLFISSATSKIGSRLSVMAAEESVDGDFRYDASAIDLLLDELHRQSDCVIVDLPRTVAATRARVLGAATDVIIVTELSLAGLRDSIRLHGLVQQVAAKARTIFVANRVAAKDSSVTKAEFEKALGRSIDFMLPEQDKAAAAAASSGKPLAAVAPSNKIVALLRTVAAGLAEARTDKAAEKRGFWRRGKS
ncbi:MAG: AAA family ATPase [Dongiaceae bacterium]